LFNRISVSFPARLVHFENGSAARPSRLYRLADFGSADQAYRTAMILLVLPPDRENAAAVRLTTAGAGDHSSPRKI